ncbi:Peroxiredoxin-2E [Forsythia ovata]|uniref:glutaredoxin-dependent peroxiredoxin n=1 Tax=Forsythia ovata TaxID=205694 RepID=A0ABD1UZ07_9LAMI
MPKISAAIFVVDKLPDATLSYFDSSNELKTVSVYELTSNKKKLFSFWFLGRLLPLIPRKHLLGFVEKAGELKAKGVDTIACIPVNDAFVMKAWKKDMNVGDEVLLSDGNEDFTKAIGCKLDLSDKLIGLEVKSIRCISAISIYSTSEKKSSN